MDQDGIDKSSKSYVDETAAASEVLNDTISAALKEAGLTAEDCTEQPQVITIEAGSETILEVSTVTEGIDDPVISIVPPEGGIGEQQNGIEEQEIHTSNLNDSHFTCCNCSDTFTIIKKFHEHKCKNFVELKEFLCKECGMVCTDDENLRKHAEMHLKQREKDKIKKQFACKKCKKVFSHKWLHENHSCQSKRFICEYCGTSYGRKSDMKRHIDNVHTVVKEFQCTSCDKKFATKWRLDQHGIIHTKRKAFQCQICGKLYSQKSHLDRHKCVHSEDSVKCKGCSRWFVNKSEFGVHTCKPNKDHKQTRFACHLCEKTFSRKNDMKRHQFLHTGNKPFQCNYCEKSFVTSWHLKHHERSHTGERPYQCHCGKQFTQKSHLDNHKILHASHVFRCKHCKRRFSDEERLTRHENFHFRDKNQKECENVIDSGFDTALECLLEFANDKTKHVDGTSHHISTEPVRSDASENILSIGDSGIVSQQNTTKTDDSKAILSKSNDDIRSESDKDLIAQSRKTDEDESANVFTYHVNPDETDDRKNVCKYCNRAYKYRTRLLKHLVTHTVFHFDSHTNFLSRQESEFLDAGGRMKLFTCLECNRTYSNEDKCNDHKLKCNSHMPSDKSESNQKPIEEDGLSIDGDLICKVCNKVFFTKPKLSKHMIYHSRRSFSYVLVKSGEPPVRMLDIKLLFVCSYCSKEFVYKTSFERHEYQHQTKLGSVDNCKPAHLHMCAQCGKDFRRITHLKRHMQLHKQNKTSKEQSLHSYSPKSNATTRKTPQSKKDQLSKSPSRRNSIQKDTGGLSLKPLSSETQHSEEQKSSVIQETNTNELNTHLTSSKSNDTGTKSKTTPFDNDKVDKCLSRIRSRPVRTRNLPKRYRNESEVAKETDVNLTSKPYPSKTQPTMKGFAEEPTSGIQDTSCVVDINVDKNEHNTSILKFDGIQVEYKKIRQSKRLTGHQSCNNGSNESSSNNKENPNACQIPLADFQKSTCDPLVKPRKMRNHKNNINVKQGNKKIKTNCQTMTAFKCKRCKKEFTSKTLLNRHQKYDPRRPLMCRVCCRRFSVQESLKRHEAGHAGSYLLSCKECGKGFNHQHTLEIHMQKHTGNKTNMCDMCGKMFSTKYNLKLHSYIHSGKSPNVCKFCGKHFGRKNDLRRHESSHDGSQPFPCSLCERKFANRWHLHYHEQSHFNKKPYNCDICLNGFSRLKDLTQHEASVHCTGSPNI